MNKEMSRKRQHITRPLLAVGASAALVLGLLLSAGPAEGVSGTAVTGSAPNATRGFPSVVILEPVGSSPNVPIPSEPVKLDQIDKTFTPGVIAARVGQVVEFHNGETLLHNVHVLNLDSGKTTLNVALPVKGMVYLWTPEAAGAYAVLCDVHPEMEAYVVVAESPYFTVAAKDGRFEFEQVPAGDYTMRIWNVKDSDSSEQQVTITSTNAEITGGR